MKLKEKFETTMISFLINKNQDATMLDHFDKIAEDFAIGFGLFLSENMYEDMYQDIDKDGKTWVSYNQEGFDNRITANRFTIQELLEIYKKTL